MQISDHQIATQVYAVLSAIPFSGNLGFRPLDTGDESQDYPKVGMCTE